MTGRANALLVVLEIDMRTDDVESLVEAIKHMRGVSDVRLNISDSNAWIAYQRAKDELTKRLWKALKTPVKSDDT